jgi:DNA-3-methyladenine glycosylase II
LEYLTHLAKDKKLGKLISQQEPFRLSKQKDIHHYLCASIMSQQLSTKVADTIHRRFLNIYEGRVPLAEEILATPFDTLRAIGLSNAKVNYVHNVARFAIDEGMDHRHLDKMTNEEVIEYLTRIKGVGRWTAEMLLMFGLGREDIFAVDDLGIQNAMIRLYKLDRTDKKTFREDLLRISKKWSPYRTYACLHLWHWKDNSPVAATPTKKK